MTRTTQITILVVLLALLSLFYRGLWGDPRHIPPVLVDTPAPVFEGPDVESGEPLSSEQYKGKVILVNFWASWCQECKVEHENLLRLYDEFKDHPEFVMVGINYQDEIPKARAYLERYGSSFPHMQDVKGALAIDFGVYGVPETFVIDKQGMIRHKWIGPIVDNVYTNLTKNVLIPLLSDPTPTLRQSSLRLGSGQALRQDSGERIIPPFVLSVAERSRRTLRPSSGQAGQAT